MALPSPLRTVTYGAEGTSSDGIPVAVRQMVGLRQEDAPLWLCILGSKVVFKDYSYEFVLGFAAQFCPGTM